MRSYIVKIAAMSDDEKKRTGLSAGLGAGLGYGAHHLLSENNGYLSLSGLKEHIDKNQLKNGIKDGEKLRLYHNGPEGAKLLDKRMARFKAMGRYGKYVLPLTGLGVGSAAYYAMNKNKDK
jgi:hypothetical protein